MLFRFFPDPQISKSDFLRISEFFQSNFTILENVRKFALKLI